MLKNIRVYTRNFENHFFQNRNTFRLSIAQLSQLKQSNYYARFTYLVDIEKSKFFDPGLALDLSTQFLSCSKEKKTFNALIINLTAQFAKWRIRFQGRSFCIYNSLVRKIYREPRWNFLFLSRKMYHDLDSCLHVWRVKLVTVFERISQGKGLRKLSEWN